MRTNQSTKPIITIPHRENDASQKRRLVAALEVCRDRFIASGDAVGYDMTVRVLHSITF